MELLSGQDRLLFQSTLPVEGATCVFQYIPAYSTIISIHAPRGGSDGINIAADADSIHFNPRSPWRERPATELLSVIENLFQSTLPVEGATKAEAMYNRLIDISIHAPRGGSDTRPSEVTMTIFIFQSTLPVEGATSGKTAWSDKSTISIHAPRGGSDVDKITGDSLEKVFQSTLPVEGATCRWR